MCRHLWQWRAGRHAWHGGCSTAPAPACQRHARWAATMPADMAMAGRSPATCPPLPRMPALNLPHVPGDGRRVAGRFGVVNLKTGCARGAFLNPGPDPGPDRVFLSVALSSFCRARAGRVFLHRAWSNFCRTRAGFRHFRHFKL